MASNPQPGGPGPRIYVPWLGGGLVIPPDIGVPFHVILRLAGYGTGIRTLLDRTSSNIGLIVILYNLGQGDTSYYITCHSVRCNCIYH